MYAKAQLSAAAELLLQTDHAAFFVKILLLLAGLLVLAGQMLVFRLLNAHRWILEFLAPNG